MYFKPNLRVAFKNNRYLRCVFHSLVVKMSAMEKKFEGGPDRFLAKHKAICNRDLAVVNGMGTHDLWPIVGDLNKNGFIPHEDATMFDATSLGSFLRNGQKVDPGIDWLTGYVNDFAVMVRMN